jgi:hypothetical protein
MLRKGGRGRKMAKASPKKAAGAAKAAPKKPKKAAASA